MAADETGARPSLAHLYGSHAAFVYRALAVLGVPPSQVEDAMQDVFIVANRHLSSFEGTFYKAWLYRLAHSVARNVRRSARRADSVPLESVDIVDQRASPFDRVANAEEMRMLHELLERLEEGQREAFILAEVEQLTHVEIAAALGVHVNTVTYRLRTAKSRLLQFLRWR
jgi:RNA polymerase sigma-70 factor, ECF subfamily